MRNKRLPFASISRSAAVLLLLICTACSGSPEGQLDVRGARDAVAAARMRRPGAPLGVFVTTFLSAGTTVRVTGAVNAVRAQAKLAGRPSSEVIDSTYQLLQEFGVVLQVDIADMLNRSDNRQQTLNEYLTGLRNITARATDRREAIERDIGLLQETQQQYRRTVSQIDRDARTALREKDYVTAGQKQQELATAQSNLSATELELKRQRQTLASYDELLPLAAKRLTAIEQNREIILAGLKVVDVPGAESLGVLEEARR